MTLLVARRPSPSLASREGRHLVLGGTRLVMVEASPEHVDRMLSEGSLNCPECAGVLTRWGHARERVVRGLVGRLRPRRARCRGCLRTHVLLPVSVLARRADSTEVIGAALVARARGRGYRPIAAMLGVAESTVRGWLRRFRQRSHGWWLRFTALLLALDPDPAAVMPRSCVFADAVEVIGLAAAAGVRRFGPRPPWQFASVVSGGLLLAPAGVGVVIG